MQWLNSATVCSLYLSATFLLLLFLMLLLLLLLCYCSICMNISAFFFHFITNDFRCFVRITCDFQCSVQFKRYRRCMFCCRLLKFYALLEHFFSLISTGTRTRCARNNDNKKGSAMHSRERKKRNAERKKEELKKHWQKSANEWILNDCCSFCMDVFFYYIHFAFFSLQFFAFPTGHLVGSWYVGFQRVFSSVNVYLFCKLQLFRSGLIKWNGQRKKKQNKKNGNFHTQMKNIQNYKMHCLVAGKTNAFWRKRRGKKTDQNTTYHTYTHGIFRYYENGIRKNRSVSWLLHANTQHYTHELWRALLVWEHLLLMHW